MRKDRLKVTFGLLSLLLVLLLPSLAYAQTACSGTLSGTFDDVIVNGGSCTLDGATVRGSVLVSSGGTLLASGGTQVNGSIQVDAGGNIELDSVTVLGDVALKDAADIIVGAAATLGTLKLEKSGAINASGAIGSIESKESEGISLDGATLFPGGVKFELGSGSLVICGSTIEGQVNVIETTGDVLAETSGSCAASTIDGSVAVEKGNGDVRLVGATLAAGDLIVVEQAGAILVEGTALSDVKVEKTSGDITLQNVTTDSDTTISENGGDVTISGSILGSDVGISLNNGVTITGNNFSLEDVLISNNSGPVVVDGNIDLSMSIIENDAVTVSNNTFTDADISKNSGGVSIVGNTGEVLKCSDNSPAPTGSGNTITELADGQCAGF